MTPRRKHRSLIVVLLFALMPLTVGWAGGGQKDEKHSHFVGKVVPLAEILAKENTRLDADAISLFLVLQAEDGKLYPLVKDSGARMFFKDAKLLRRPMRLTARLVPNSQFLQVINVHSFIKGKLHEIYYWCDICTIKRHEAGVCDCCGAAMDFHEVPWKGD